MRGSLVSPNARAARLVTAFAVVPAVVVGVIVLVTAGPIAGVVALVVVAAALVGWARMAGDRRALARLGGRNADPERDARLCNLVEGLSIGAGLRQPRLLVIDSPALNAVATGTTPGRAVVGVTSGLLAELDRIELEAVLAEELAQIRHHETLPATVLVATFGLGRRWALPTDRDARADQHAVALTRYPPALALALEKVEAKGAVVAGQPGYMAPLWLVDPRPGGGDGYRRLPLRERIEALREL
jgi:heat shock protein HtpX